MLLTPQHAMSGDKSLGKNFHFENKIRVLSLYQGWGKMMYKSKKLKGSSKNYEKVSKNTKTIIRYDKQ